MAEEKTLEYWKQNAEEDYMKVPISVLRYIGELETARIEEAIKRYNIVNKERSELNKQIRDHYEPLLTKAAKEQDKERFKELIDELPDCSFVLSALRIGELYKVL